MTAWSANAPAVVRRLARAFPAISPRTRARLLAAFLAANLVIVLLPAVSTQRLAWSGFTPWVEQLEANIEGTPANTYAGIIWGGVAVLALAQLLPPPPGRQRWFWRLGWLSMALIAALIACEEGFSLLAKDRAAHLDLGVVAPAAYWLVVAAPLAAPLVAAAGWVLWISQRGHPARTLLTGLAAALAAGSIAVDAGVLHVTPIAWEYLLEEGMEVMAAALFAVMLAETLGHAATNH